MTAAKHKMSDFATLANDAISELKRVKGDSLRFNTPAYLAIYANDTIEYSNLWLILKDAAIAVVILPYTYKVITAEDSSAFVLFIDATGHCNDSIDLNGWNLKFDSPKEGLYRTYNRYATISKVGHEITLKTPYGTLTPDDFKRIWKYFKLISNINEDYVSLQLFRELYEHEVTIESLKTENIRKEYERFTSATLLKANQELLEYIKLMINSTK